MSKRQTVLDFLAHSPAGQFTSAEIAAGTELEISDVATICSQLRHAGKIASDKADRDGRKVTLYGLGSGTAAAAAKRRKAKKAKAAGTAAAKKKRRVNKARKTKGNGQAREQRSKRTPHNPPPIAPNGDGYRVWLSHEGGVLQQKQGQPDLELTPSEAAVLAGFVAEYFSE